MFQSTRPRGARQQKVVYLGLIVVFQSTRPRGARLPSRSRVIFSCEFQSTRPRGARRVSSYSTSEPFLFQSTRPRGARPDAMLSSGCSWVSIHAPTGGATFLQQPWTTYFQFQSTRPRGARRISCSSRRPPTCFNPRAHGGRDTKRVHTTKEENVSIHAPMGGAT